MSRNTKLKIFYFVVVLAAYFIIAGADVRSVALWRTTRFYVLAAIIAFWAGGEPFGVYQKMSVRPIAIFVGAVTMVVMFILMLLLKEALHHYDHAV